LSTKVIVEAEIINLNEVNLIKETSSNFQSYKKSYNQDIKILD